MKIQFLGATQTVTGSKYLLQLQDKNVLIDCGLFQGLKNLRLKNWASFPFDPKNIDAVLLTHAHLDHSGYLPKLVKEGFSGPIFATASSYRLADILLRDSAYLMEEDATYANKHGFSKHKPALPLYTSDDVKKTLPLFQKVDFQAPIELGAGLVATFKRAGHILGASSIKLSDGYRTIMFSGDLGRPQDPMMEPPEPIGDTDYLVVESTYGDREHEKTSPTDQLESVIDEVVKKKGVLIIPAFAVGRSQIILYHLSKLKKLGKLPDIPVFLDSPMATNVTDLYCAHRDDHKMSEQECKELCAVAHYVHSANESESIDHRKGPMIIISASGMATGGRVLHHLKAFVSNERNTVLFAGYQAAGTRGADMIAGTKNIKIHGQHYPVRATVKVIHNLSAHADYKEILSWLKTTNKPPKTTFITHGEPTASEHLRRFIQESMHWHCTVPEFQEVYSL